MKRPLNIAMLLLAAQAAMAQPFFNLTIQELALPESPGVHSFAVGQHGGKWLIIGGRTDGLHRRQPWAAFLAEGNSVSAHVIDPVTSTVWSASIASLPVAQFEQLQSTNMEFAQRDTVLYIMGGYGRSEAQNDHVTHDLLSAVNIPGAISAIINGTSVAPHFRYVQDSRMAVTGGYMHLLNGTFYQVGGQFFEGRYNPMGPNNGPGFIQQYKEAVQKFNITDNGSTLALTDYSETTDAANLHRRDYNLVPQIFPDGQVGFTAFTGVFQHAVDLPWLNTVNVLPDSYTVNNSFNQLLNQYHSAHLPIYDEVNNSMHTVFFGGMGRYYFDPQSGTLIEDDAVPFVKTISMVTRNNDGSMTETALDMAMPDYLGSGAEFIPLNGVAYEHGEILSLNALPVGQPTLVGHIFGGIQSTDRNIFFTNDGTQSHASNRVFKVFIEPDVTAVNSGTVISGKEVFRMQVFPNPVQDMLRIDLTAPFRTAGTIVLRTISGSTVRTANISLEAAQQTTLSIDCSGLGAGSYVVQFDNGVFTREETVIIRR
ncbi:MAG: T9SS type A sorting domain-containing protein [Flavobacteriales bacterium]|nr:T9SS type A sorting domain-containing protein [Flavobacteriales bacterium]